MNSAVQNLVDKISYGALLHQLLAEEGLSTQQIHKNPVAGSEDIFKIWRIYRTKK